LIAHPSKARTSSRVMINDPLSGEYLSIKRDYIPHCTSVN
jgi:hypothetical protein